MVEVAEFWPAPRRVERGVVTNPGAGCAHPPRIPVVAFSDGWFTLPEVPGREGNREVAEIEVEYRAAFGTTSVTWSETMEVAGSFQWSLPVDARVLSPLQREWVTGLAVQVHLHRNGSDTDLEVEPAWFVVTDDGVEWLDRERVVAEAPSGAWSQAARATIAEQEREGVWVLPPSGGE